jgi:hypothetical protein
MPVHDWTRDDAGIFHACHHFWITDIASALNCSTNGPKQQPIANVQDRVNEESILHETINEARP